MDGSASTTTKVNSKTIYYVPLSHLVLDRENPRLASEDTDVTKTELIRILWTEMAVDEVALSIAANGYFPEEPLFVIPEKSGKADPEKDHFIVVEGNRRLAAVLLLRNPKLRAEIRADLPPLDVAAQEQLERLPVSIYDNRKELWQYLGFRHINGPKEWDAFSKAQYVAKVHEQYHIPLSEIARRIGDQHYYVKRIYRGYLLVKQAESQARFSPEDVSQNRFNFSHLYTAASQKEFQDFLGIDADGSLKPNPVPKSKLPHLKELMRMLYGSRAESLLPVIRTQHKDLAQLGEVLQKPAALAALRSGYPLKRAHEISVGDKRRFEEAMTRAKEDLLLAKGTVTTGYEGNEDLYTVIGEIIDLANRIQTEMGQKKSKKSSKD
jgi:hypothetical protein